MFATRNDLFQKDFNPTNMKQIITRKLLVLLLFCAFSFSSFAQDEINTEFINRMNYVFSPLEKNRVPNGLLLDYAM
ncbi:MAG: hypothetical protein C4329_14865 [Chitinophagaceae bacterium]